MTFTEKEKDNLKKMFVFLVNKKSEQTGQHNGFTLWDLEPILHQLRDEKQITERKTINSTSYFKN